MSEELGMSLIEEALRRAGGVITTGPVASFHSTAASVTPPGRIRRQPSARSLFVSGVIVSLGLASWYLVWSGQIVRLRTASAPLTEMPVESSLETQIIPPTGMEIAPWPAPLAAAYRLSGIVFGPGAPVAVINNHIVHPGDTIDHMRVTHISHTGVTLEDGTAQVTLRLGD